MLETQGGDKFFGEPALDIADFLRVDRDGRGVINILAADRLMRSPRLYATFLLWLLSELFETLPEVGDLDKPKLVFFFDEAHLLFDDAPKALLSAIEQVVRLIRSKGVGVYFVTQNPLDVPDTVLGQLGNRIQHALRAFTPRDQKAVRAAAETFRKNPRLRHAEAIMQLGVGEALVSMLDAKGTPEIVERTLIAPPSARVGPITPEERAGSHVARAHSAGNTTRLVDRESAFEMLQGARRQGRGRKRRRRRSARGARRHIGRHFRQGRQEAHVARGTCGARRDSDRRRGPPGHRSRAKFCAACWAACRSESRPKIAGHNGQDLQIARQTCAAEPLKRAIHIAES